MQDNLFLQFESDILLALDELANLPLFSFITEWLAKS